MRAPGVRALLETIHMVAPVLTENEASDIARILNRVLNRLEKEAEKEQEK